jgi:peptidyl-prolyl cis-trans isomerase A (cyclophilin A)
MSRMKIIAALAIILSTGALMAADGWKKQAGTYAVIETELGTMVCKLFPEKAPETVANFVGLAEGTKEFKDLKTGEMVKRPFYDGIVFHRVIPDFMIQTGDPLGKGTGGPGYQFEDEFDKSLRFDRKGILAMANSGPGTNGSQFFITVAPTTWLNDRHSIFGEVVDGQSVADAISKAQRDPNDRPLKTLSMKKVTIERVK